jgi:hypothetical protein
VAGFPVSEGIEFVLIHTFGALLTLAKSQESEMFGKLFQRVSEAPTNPQVQPPTHQ